MAAWRYEISLLVLKKYFTRSLRSLVKYFSTLEEKFRMSARPCNILYVFLGETPYGRLMSASYIHSEGPVSSSALNTIRVFRGSPKF